MLTTLMSIHQQLGESEPGLVHGRRALALARATLGPSHPMLGKLLINIAVAESDRGEHEQARVGDREGLEVLERAYGAARGPRVLRVD